MHENSDKSTKELFSLTSKFTSRFENFYSRDLLTLICKSRNFASNEICELQTDNVSKMKLRHLPVHNFYVRHFFKN